MGESKVAAAALIVPAGPGAVLAERVGGRFFLPRVTFAAHAVPTDETLLDAASDRLGVPVELVRIADQAPPDAVVVVRPLAPVRGDRWSWVDADRTHALVEHAGTVERFLAEERTGVVPAARPPWYRTGWFAEISRWCDAA